MARVRSLGNSALLERAKVALLCSVKCPGSAILRTYDLMRDVRNEKVIVISGFHSPMEQECLTILLRGTCGIILCPARGLPARIRTEFRKPIDDGRMLVLSAFDDKLRRATIQSSAVRNRFVAQLADAVFVPYASPGGSTETLCAEIVRSGKLLYTFAGEYNGNLIGIGAVPLEHDSALTALCDNAAALQGF
ncbi:MAG: DNA-binding protein [Armatimonadota bacterium]|nr:DNA-binding protein [Armatimonadota bacterium]